MGLVGIIFNISWLRFPPGAVMSVKGITSVAMVLGGLSLLLLRARQPFVQGLSRYCAGAILIIGVATICEYLFSIDLSIGGLLRGDLRLPDGIIPLDHMTPTVAFAYAAVGLSLLILKSGKQQLLAGYVASLGLLALFTSFLGLHAVTESYGVGSYKYTNIITQFPWPACIAMASLGFGILLAEPRTVLYGLLCSSTRGGYITRRFLLLSLVVPIFFAAAAAFGARAHLYNEPIRWTLFVTGTILSFCWLTCLIAKQLDASDRSRIALAEQRADIVYSLAHDLKVPVIGTERALNILLDGSLGELAQQQRSILAMLQDSAGDQLRMIDNLVYEFRCEQGKETINPTPYRVTTLLNDCLAKLVPALKSRNLRIKVRHKLPLEAVDLDIVAMRRVINNLLHNALKYAPVDGELEIQSGTEGKAYQFSIRNSGKSISSESQKHLFERFWQSEDSHRLSAGNGLGLYICRRIVEAHGGEIACQSSPETGTTFYVNLPHQRNA